MNQYYLEAVYLHTKHVKNEKGDFYFLTFANEEAGFFNVFYHEPLDLDYLQKVELVFDVSIYQNRPQLKLSGVNSL